MKKKLGRPVIKKSLRRVRITATIDPKVKKRVDALKVNTSDFVERALIQLLDGGEQNDLLAYAEDMHATYD